MPLLPWMKKEGSDNSIEVSMNEEDKKKLDAASAAASELPEIKKRLGALDSIQAYFEEQKKEKEEARKKEAEAAARKNTESADAELEELFLTDPAKAFQIANERANSGRDKVLLQVRADNLRRETFENSEKFPYYHGNLKAEIDKLLMNEPVETQNNPNVIENAYHVVVGKHHAEIMEGKIKNRFAQGAGSSMGAGSGHAGEHGADSSDNRWKADNPLVQKAARLTGIPAEEYAKRLNDEGVGYV